MRDVIYTLVVAAIVYVCFSLVRSKLLERRCRAACEAVYGGTPQSLAFEMKYLYGFPAFTITFRSKEEREAAAAQGLNDAFKKAIGELCGRFGARDNPYDPDRAVFFTYEGHVSEMMAATREAEWGRR